MAKESINREYKDRLFKYIFGNEKHKDLTLSLYNAINNTHYDCIDDIEITTIENAVYMGMHNDLSFIIADSMNIYEQQSTYNPNMPLRMLVYTGQLYAKLLETEEKDDVVYNSTVIPLPYPKLIVFYNGDRFQPDKTELKLSDAFREGAKGDIQVKVTMLNVNYGRNMKLLRRCRPLSDYSLFTTTVRELKRKNKNKTTEEAVEETLKLLPNDSEVKKLIQENKAAVAKMFLFEYDEKAVLEAQKKDAIEKVAKIMIKDNVPFEKISKYTEIPIEELKKLN